jgi:hypothetical protein
VFALLVATSVMTLIYEGVILMKRLIASVVLAIALLTSGVVVTQYSMVGTAQADEGGGE